MDNKLRIQRVKEGIKMLEKGEDPFDSIDYRTFSFKEYLGINWHGFNLLATNEACIDDINNGFKYGNPEDVVILLHNWKRFLELIEKIK